MGSQKWQLNNLYLQTTQTLQFWEAVSSLDHRLSHLFQSHFLFRCICIQQMPWTYSTSLVTRMSHHHFLSRMSQIDSPICFLGHNLCNGEEIYSWPLIRLITKVKVDYLFETEGVYPALALHLTCDYSYLVNGQIKCTILQGTKRKWEDFNPRHWTTKALFPC